MSRVNDDIKHNIMIARQLPTRLISLVLASALIVLLGASCFGSSKFISGFSDMPLMPEMEEVQEANVAFDTTGGRIVIAFGRSRLSQEKIIYFYEQSLEQLGWVKKGFGRFFRESEVLTIDFSPDGDYLLVRFSLEPY